jgi:alanyl-tRNA synthetase
VRQQGSLVEPDRLRFDFSHHGPVDRATLELIEHEVNERVWANDPVETREMPLQEALALGAMAFFADKYGERVRVVSMGDSIELCGGTHVGSTGALGLFQVTSQGGVAAGVRRVEAVTGPVAYGVVDTLERRIAEAGELLKAHPEQLARRIEQLLEEKEKLEHRLREALKGAAAETDGQRHEIGGVALTVADTTAEDRDEVGQVADRFREGRKESVLVLFGTAGRGAIHVAVTDDLIQRGLRAGDLLNRVAAVSGGRGGGRPAFASGSAGDVGRLTEARQATPRLVEEWLAGH